MKLTVRQLKQIISEAIQDNEERSTDVDLNNELNIVEVGDVVDVDVDEIGTLSVRVLELVDDVNNVAGPRAESGPGADFHGPGFVGEIDPASGESGEMVFSMNQVMPGSKAKGYFPHLGEPEAWTGNRYGDEDDWGREVKNPYRKMAKKFANQAISRHGDYAGPDGVQVEGLKPFRRA